METSTMNMPLPSSPVAFDDPEPDAWAAAKEQRPLRVVPPIQRSRMMQEEARPVWADLRRHLIARDDAIGWAGVAAAGGLVLYMAIGMLVAWIAGRL